MPEHVERLTSVPAGRVRIVDVERTFPTQEGPRTVLRDVTLEVIPGEIIAVVGPSGCGKSTLLRLIGGLDSPTAGSITLDDDEVRAHDDSTAIAFQEPRLLPWRTIAQNVALGLPRGTRGRAAKDRVAELLDLVGLTHAASQRPREVSGGMAQRASLARALARSPQVLLLDEPFGALDALTRLKMQDLLLDIHRAQPTTVVLVTHDVEEALYLADHVLMLRNLHAAQAEPERPPARRSSRSGRRPASAHSARPARTRSCPRPRTPSTGRAAPSAASSPYPARVPATGAPAASPICEPACSTGSACTGPPPRRTHEHPRQTIHRRDRRRRCDDPRPDRMRAGREQRERRQRHE